MFETAELGRKASKEEYREAVPALRTELLRVQNDLRLDPKFAVVIVIAGVEGSGKGDTVNVLHEWMDPRFLETHALGVPTREEAQRPFFWRFWRTLPARGRIGIFFGSWYTGPIMRRIYGELDDASLGIWLAHIRAFEQQLLDGDTLVLKFWFHVSKKAQKKRFKALAKDDELSWRVTDTDWKLHDRYDDFVPVCERVVRETSTGEAPWTIVEAADRRYRDLYVARHIQSAIAARLEDQARRDAAGPEPRREPGEAGAATTGSAPGERTVLGALDLSGVVAADHYRAALRKLQGRLNQLARSMQECGASTVMLFEGWDAAGKGGAIRRVTAALDARFYRVVPISAPTDEERSHPYLWRFWRQLPEAGRLTIFDRSWYGRVLVERVEGFASPEQWRRAYLEINEFESLLAEHGYGLAKFWLHIDRDEQAKRFAEREQTAYKKYKVTDEDYRNREKWSLYEDAVNEMVERTSTAHAPWTLVPANDKRHARLTVLEACCDAFESALAGKQQG